MEPPWSRVMRTAILSVSRTDTDMAQCTTAQETDCHALSVFPSPFFACLIRAPSSQFRAGVVGCESAVDSIRPYVLHAIEAFGVERCIFASDFPVDKLFSSYDAVFNAFKAITKDFSARGQRALFHDNAERVYRF
ncbi:hypothetical protein QFZ94_007781 [Paraburkholderia sp. JPY465]